MITKQCWKKIGMSPLTTTNLKVNMTNGKVVQPMGLVKDLKIKVHKLNYYSMMVVMDFLHKPGYEIVEDPS